MYLKLDALENISDSRWLSFEFTDTFLLLANSLKTCCKILKYYCRYMYHLSLILVFSIRTTSKNAKIFK